MGQTEKLLALAVNQMGTEEGENAAGQVYRRVMKGLFSEPFTTSGIGDSYAMKRSFRTVAVDPSCGACLSRFAGQCAAVADIHNFHLVVKWNDAHIVFPPGKSADEVYAAWNRLTEARSAAYRASAEYKRRQEESERAARDKAASLTYALAGAPIEPDMSRNPDGWAKSVEANRDPYGAAAINYAATWARLMENEISAGASLESCADRLSHLADTDGITGFMYGCAVSILSQCWVHGEALRVWHNRGYGVESETGTVNPAVLTLGVPN